MPNFVAGPYAVSYAGSSIGITERGFELEQNFFEEPIIGDALGDTVMDAVYLGGEAFFNAVLQEYGNATARAALWPYATVGQTGQVGRLHSDIASPLVLTVVAGTRAAAHGPATVTAPLALLPGNFPVRILFSARHRKVPIRMRALPNLVQYSGQGNAAWFSIS